MSETRARSRSPIRSASPSADFWRCKNCNKDNPDSNPRCTKCRLRKGTDRQDMYKEDWECTECHANNFSRRLDCFKCHRRKPPTDPNHPDDWECVKCKGNNFSKRTECFKCGEPKPHFVSSGGDWECPRCRGNNYSRRIDCFKCGEAKPYIPSGAAKVRPGDWQCSKCRLNNFSWRDQCFHCGEEKRSEERVRSRSPAIRSFIAGGGSSLVIPAPDVDPVTGEAEWTCPVCAISNFYKRQDCYRCHEKKPGSVSSPYLMGSVTAVPVPKKRFPTDWICPSCGGLNFSRREDCFKCSKPKPENLMDEDVNSFSSVATTLRPGDWNCPSCLGHNYSRRTTCYNCQADKPAEGGDNM